jgi:hypothetical protein
MIKRDEFNYFTGLQLAAAPIPYVRQALVSISRTRHHRNQQPAIDLTATPAPATDQHS